MLNSSRQTFAEKLAAWRDACEPKVSQQELDRRIGKGKGYAAQIEAGRIKPPEKSVCYEIAAALGIEGETVWLAAANERLQAFDSDLGEWCTARMAEARGMRLDDSQVRLLDMLHRLETAYPLPAHTPQWGDFLTALMDAGLTPDAEGQGKPGRGFIRILVIFATLPLPAQQALLRAFEHMTWAVGCAIDVGAEARAEAQASLDLALQTTAPATPPTPDEQEESGSND